MLVFAMATSEHLSASSYRDVAWVVELNRYGMELVGLWPAIDERTKSNFASDLRVCIIFILVTFFSLVPFAWSLIRVWGNMTLMIDNLQVTLSYVVVMLKIVIMRFKRTAVSSIVKMILQDWMEVKTDRERTTMMRQMQILRVIIICAYFLMISGVIVGIVLPTFGLPYRHFTNLTDGKRPLPLQAYYFYDTDKSPQFEITVFVQAMSTFLGAIIYTSVDAFFGLVMFHIYSQLKNFQCRLVDMIVCKDFDSALRRNVETHRRIIRFANNIEDTFSLLMLALVFYFGAVFCLCSFVFLSVLTDHGDVSLSGKSLGIMGTFILLAHTSLYCGAGEILTGRCDALYRAIYELDWYKLESRKAKCFMLLMLRAKDPLRITAGKIVPLTMATFCSLLKTSAGYISLLLALRS